MSLFQSFPTIIKGTTTSGIRISNVAGYYFLDNCPEFISYTGKRVRLKDSGGKYLDVVLGARGTSETTTTIYTSDFSAGVNGWTKYDSDGVVSTLTSVSSKLRIDVTTQGTSSVRPAHGKIITGKGYYNIYYAEIDYIVNSGTCKLTNYSVGSNLITQNNTLSGSGTFTIPRVTSSSADFYNNISLYWDGRSLFQVDLSQVRVYRIDTPSSSGIYFTGTAESGFTYNQATYTYEIFDIMRIPA
jgi:hypothetical protein